MAVFLEEAQELPVLFAAKANPSASARIERSIAEPKSSNEGGDIEWFLGSALERNQVALLKIRHGAAVLRHPTMVWRRANAGSNRGPRVVTRAHLDLHEALSTERADFSFSPLAVGVENSLCRSDGLGK